MVGLFYVKHTFSSSATDMHTQSGIRQDFDYIWQTYVPHFRFDSTLPRELNSDILRSDIESSSPLICGLSAQPQQSSLNLLHIRPDLTGKSLEACCETFPFSCHRYVCYFTNQYILEADFYLANLELFFLFGTINEEGAGEGEGDLDTHDQAVVSNLNPSWNKLFLMTTRLSFWTITMFKKNTEAG